MWDNLVQWFDSLGPALAAYGYAGLFLSNFIAALAIPIPAYIVLAGAGALAAQGRMSIFLVIIIALTANVAADLFAFFLARKYGKDVLIKIGFSRLLTSKTFKKLEGYIEEFPYSIIFVTRLVTEGGPIVNLLTGLSRVKKRTFIIFDILGELAYVLIFALAGYFLGDAWQNHTDFIYKGIAVLIIFGILAGVAKLLLPKPKAQ